MQTPKEAAIGALRFVRRFGWVCSSTGTRGLVRLPSGQVEEQFISYSRAGKVIRSRRPVSQEELSQWCAIGFLEDHYEQATQAEGNCSAH